MSMWGGEVVFTIISKACVWFVPHVPFKFEKPVHFWQQKAKILKIVKLRHHCCFASQHTCLRSYMRHSNRANAIVAHRFAEGGVTSKLFKGYTLVGRHAWRNYCTMCLLRALGPHCILRCKLCHSGTGCHIFLISKFLWCFSCAAEDAPHPLPPLSWPAHQPCETPCRFVHEVLTEIELFYNFRFFFICSTERNLLCVDRIQQLESRQQNDQRLAEAIELNLELVDSAISAVNDKVRLGMDWNEV